MDYLLVVNVISYFGGYFNLGNPTLIEGDEILGNEDFIEMFFLIRLTGVGSFFNTYKVLMI